MSEKLRIGVAGLGTVGSSLLQIIHNNNEGAEKQLISKLTVSAVCARDQLKDRGIQLAGLKWFDDPVKLAQSDQIDVFVELMGGDSGIVEESVRAALNHGKHVVTANKALLAKHGTSLAQICEMKNVSLNYEAAVAGGIPIIKTMRETLAGTSVSRIYGILNGTCNYILTRMEQERLSFKDCLEDAQKLGYAEADPTFDIEGNDTSHKLAILTSVSVRDRNRI